MPSHLGRDLEPESSAGAESLLSIHRARVACCAVASLIVLCCSSGAAANAAARGWWRVEIDAVSQPVNVDGVLVLYAVAGGALRLIGLNAASGATLWSLPASSGSNSPGQPPALAVSGDEVVYLRAAAG